MPNLMFVTSAVVMLFCIAAIGATSLASTSLVIFTVVKFCVLNIIYKTKKLWCKEENCIFMHLHRPTYSDIGFHSYNFQSVHLGKCGKM